MDSTGLSDETLSTIYILKWDVKLQTSKPNIYFILDTSMYIMFAKVKQ